MPKPPRDVTEALRDGGIPQNFELRQLQWLADRTFTLGSRAEVKTPFDLARLRWSATYNDLVTTIITEHNARRR